MLVSTHESKVVAAAAAVVLLYGVVVAVVTYLAYVIGDAYNEPITLLVSD
jgi:hypothetical protein